MGLNQIFASGGSYGRGPGQQGSWQSGFGGAPYNFGSFSGGTVSGQVAQGAQFHVGMGAMSGPSGGGRGGRRRGSVLR